MNKKLIILLLILPTSIFSKQVINSGHQSPVKFIEYLGDNDLFFSLSMDGTLVIKKSNSDKISKRFFLSNNRITHLALSDNLNQLAIVESDSSSQFIVSVWDWELEKKLYSINMKEFPMSVGFSGGGNYLYITSISSSPVKIYRARSGAETTYLKENNSFIDYLYIGSSEQTAYLYSSSGTIDIRALKSPKLLKSIKTEKNLTQMTLSADKRYLIGKKDNNLYLIGRNDGIVYSKLVVNDLDIFKLNQATGEIVCYINNRYKKTIRNIQVVGGSFFESSDPEILIKQDIEVLNSAINKIVFADSKGIINYYDNWNNTTSNFLSNDIINLDDVTIIDNIAAIATSNTIFLLESPFFSDKLKNSRRLLSFNLKEYKSPLQNPTGSMNYNGNLLLWNESLALFDISTGETIFNHKFTSEIIDIKIKDDMLLALDKNGVVKIVDLKTNNISFSFKSPGFTSVGFYSDHEVIGGIDKSHGGSLMILDIKTKETFPIKTSLDVVFNITESNKSYIIYITGLKRINGNNSTHLIEYNLLTKTEKTHLKNESEVLNASFDVDDKNIIYTNLGTKSILKIDTNTGRIKFFQLTTNQTKNILHEDGAIYTINENKSLSIWNPTTGKKIIDFYLFKDKEWVAISSDKITAFGSPGSDKYLSSN